MHVPVVVARCHFVLCKKDFECMVCHFIRYNGRLDHANPNIRAHPEELEETGPTTQAHVELNGRA